MSNLLCFEALDRHYASLHTVVMQPNIPKLLKKMVETLGNQSKLARRLGGGITQPQVSRWMNGAQPELPNYQRIIALASALELIGDVRSEDVSAGLDKAPTGKVKIKGYVGAGSEAHYYALADEDYEEVDAPLGATDNTVAVEIRGKSWGPLLDSWLVFYDDVRSPVTDDLIGLPCVVGLSDDRILVKQIKRDRDGSFTLISNSAEPPIKNAQIEWAARVTDMRPR